jgi:hypothetical protein
MVNPTIQSNIQKRDSLIRELSSVRIHKDKITQEINEKSATLSEIKNDIVRATAIRDRILNDEIPNIKKMVITIKSHIN